MRWNLVYPRGIERKTGWLADWYHMRKEMTALYYKGEENALTRADHNGATGYVDLLSRIVSAGTKADGQDGRLERLRPVRMTIRLEGRQICQ